MDLFIKTAVPLHPQFLSLEAVQKSNLHFGAGTIMFFSMIFCKLLSRLLIYPLPLFLQPEIKKRPT